MTRPDPHPGSGWPAELRERIETLESLCGDAPPEDFGRGGWAWLLLLGIVLPVSIALAGWAWS